MMNHSNAKRYIYITAIAVIAVSVALVFKGHSYSNGFVKETLPSRKDAVTIDPGIDGKSSEVPSAPAPTQPTPRELEKKRLSDAAKDRLYAAAKNLSLKQGVSVFYSKKEGKGQILQMKQIQGQTHSRLEMEFQGKPAVLLQTPNGVYVETNNQLLKVDFAKDSVGSSVRDVSATLALQPNDKSQYTSVQTAGPEGASQTTITEEYSQDLVAKLVTTFATKSSLSGADALDYAKRQIPASTSYVIDDASNSITAEEKYNGSFLAERV